MVTLIQALVPITLLVLSTLLLLETHMKPDQLEDRSTRSTTLLRPFKQTRNRQLVIPITLSSSWILTVILSKDPEFVGYEPMFHTINLICQEISSSHTFLQFYRHQLELQEVEREEGSSIGVSSSSTDRGVTLIRMLFMTTLNPIQLTSIPVTSQESLILIQFPQQGTSFTDLLAPLCLRDKL